MSIFDVEGNNLCLFLVQYELYKHAYTLGIKCEVLNAITGVTKHTTALDVRRLIFQM
jgi:hypothetical protein